MKSDFIARILLGLAAALILSSAASAEVLKIVVDDTIQPITGEYIARAIDEAQRRNDQAVLIEINTPGGLVDSTREIIEKITTSPVPVIVYVAPSGSRAGSAGIFILEAADVAAMAPGTNAGAAHPVVLGGEKLDDIMKQKIENDTAALMRSVVSRRGRNVEAAQSAVLQSKSFTDQEALSHHLIDYVASSQDDLFRQMEGKSFKRFNGQEVTLKLSGQPIVPFGMTLKERILDYLMDPNIAFILLAIGALALYAEFNHPGAVVPGTVGVVFILIAVFALNLLPTRFAALGLILAAFALFAAEAKFASSRRPNRWWHHAAHARRAAPRRFAHPGNAGSPAHRARRQRSTGIDYRVPDGHRPESSPQQEGQWLRGIDRRNRHCPNLTLAARKNIRSRRNLGRRFFLRGIDRPVRVRAPGRWTGAPGRASGGDSTRARNRRPLTEL